MPRSARGLDTALTTGFTERIRSSARLVGLCVRTEDSTLRPLRPTQRWRWAAVLAVIVAVVLGAATAPVAAAAPGPNTGFALPFSGAPGFEYLAPPKLTDRAQLNQPLGQKAA